MTTKIITVEATPPAESTGADYYKGAPLNAAEFDQNLVNLRAAVDRKASLSNPTFTGTVVLPATTSIGDVSATELQYLNSVTSNVQDQINSKAPINNPTFTGTVSLPGGTANGVAYLNGSKVLTSGSALTFDGTNLRTGGITFADASTQSTGGYTGFRNRIINGAMMIDQRNAGASVTVDNAQVYTLDRFRAQDATDGAFSVQQVADAPAGFINSAKITITTADTSLGATQFANFTQFIEGNNVADLNWGTANAKTVTLSFWVKSSLTGTFGGSLLNSAVNRSYPFSYIINTANTWEQKTVTIAGDTAGTWLTNNGTGIAVHWGLGVGSTYSGTAGTWASTLYLSATGATSVVGTNGATFYITGVQLEKGSVATPFEFRPYGTELALCQRYYEKSYTQTAVPGSTTIDGCFMTVRIDSVGCATDRYKVTKRAAPTITTYNPETGAAGQCRNYTTSTNLNTSGVGIGDTGFYFVAGSAGNGIGIHWVASAEL